MTHEWVVDHPAPPRSTDPEGVHCTQCGMKALRWIGFFVVAVEDPARVLAQRLWEGWKTTKRVSNFCPGKKPPRPV